jgi:hypothetical protein
MLGVGFLVRLSPWVPESLVGFSRAVAPLVRVLTGRSSLLLASSPSVLKLLAASLSLPLATLMRAGAARRWCVRYRRHAGHVPERSGIGGCRLRVNHSLIRVIAELREGCT